MGSSRASITEGDRSTAPSSSWILVVEDDDGIRETLCFALEMEGYSVRSAANGKSALETLDRESLPCLIFLDLMMPVMNGWEFLSALRSRGDLAAPPVVVMTAFSEKATPPEARELIKKPVELAVILRVAENFCGRFARQLPKNASTKRY